MPADLDKYLQEQLEAIGVNAKIDIIQGNGFDEKLEMLKSAVNDLSGAPYPGYFTSDFIVKLFLSD